MKLCYIAPANSIHTRRWAQAFAARGHEVHLVVVPGDEAPEVEGVTVHQLPRGRPKVRFGVWAYALHRIAAQTRADVLHGHYVSRYGWLAAASLFRPLVLTAWGSDIYVDPLRSATGRRVTALALSRADLVTVDAVHLRDAVVAAGARTDRTALVQWGVDLATFRPDVDTSRLRAQLDLGHAPVILSTRALTPLYHQHVILEALPAIRAAVPGTRLVIKYGTFDDAYLERIRADVVRLGLKDAVTLVGQTSHGELAAYYALGDVFVSIASSDSTPVSLLEAMACGAAPVVSDLPALAEWVRDGENGFVTRSTDAQALARAVTTLLRNPGLREEMAASNFRLVAERANHATEMDRMEALYLKLCGRRP